MKKLFTLFMLITVTLSFVSCYDKSTITDDDEIIIAEDMEYISDYNCDKCDKPMAGGEYIETVSGDYLCFTCAFCNDYTKKCKNCAYYFQSEPIPDGTNYYCHACAEENASSCCFCEEGYFDYDQLVEFSYNDMTYHMCVNCCSAYFYNSQSTPPCWGCSYCGEILGGTPYPLYDCDDKDLYMACKDCLIENNLKKCNQCKKYYDKGKNGVCGLCIETKETN